MTTGDVCYSVSDYGKLFVRHYKNENLTQDEIDKVVVDFINYFAGKYWVDLAMCTEDLRSKQHIKNPYAVIDKDWVLKHLKFHKGNFKERFCLNEVLDAFIEGYHCSEINTPWYIIDARKNKEKRRYKDREATIRHLLSIVSEKYIAGDVKKYEIEEILSFFLIPKDFYNTIAQSQYSKAHFGITPLSEKYQIEGLKKLITFLKQKKYL